MAENDLGMVGAIVVKFAILAQNWHFLLIFHLNLYQLEIFHLDTASVCLFGVIE